MGKGYLTLQVLTADSAAPISGAEVKIYKSDGTVLYTTVTNANGYTEVIALSAPDKEYSLNPDYLKPAYSVCNVDVKADGLVTEHIHNVEILDTQTSILPVEMTPLDLNDTVLDEDIDIPPIGLLVKENNRQSELPPVVGPPQESPYPELESVPLIETPEGRVLKDVVIPDYITVHLGIPTNASARNVRVKFIDYVKNVTSSEIYSTWPTNSIIANVHVIVTFAINRIYTEWYRSRGFNFDITNSTSYDQYYREGAQISQNISQIVDGIFNVYVRRMGFANPFFTSFCNGTTAKCDGLSQWGTVTLAKIGVIKNTQKKQSLSMP